MKRILVATDGSAGADRAVDTAASLAHELGALLTIVTVQDRVPGDAVEAFEAVEHVARGEVGEIASRGILFRAQERAARAGASEVKLRFETGDPTEAILRTAKEQGAEAIVVGRRGRGRLAGLLLGSVSQKLVCLAPCGVIVVP